jgi:hypothetical protein
VGGLKRRQSKEKQAEGKSRGNWMQKNESNAQRQFHFSILTDKQVSDRGGERDRDREREIEREIEGERERERERERV